MRFRLFSSVLISASMIAAPVFAAPLTQPAAAKLSLSNARSGAATTGNSRLGEGAGGIFALALLAGIAAILIVGELANDNNGDDPRSP